MARRKLTVPRRPTDTDLDRMDDALVAPAEGDENFDTASVEEVLQAETGMPDRPIPVRLVNPVNVNQLPTAVGGMFSKAIPAAPALAVKVVNADPRRASVTMAASIIVAIGRSQAEANDANAFHLEGNQGPYRFHFTEEVWARAATGSGAGRLSIMVENWTR